MNAGTEHAVVNSHATATQDPTFQRRANIAAGTPTLSKTETVFCGATAGVVSRFVIAPLDVVKIRLQVSIRRSAALSIRPTKLALDGLFYSPPVGPLPLQSINAQYI